ncbi:unnamed protein product [Brassica napus]|uniref:(rape) hypothetical protein n=1 Tax=Brassica napus TaxID=3708 RepID=A0A817AQW4_BRANA|nr:unnamed protein product [Brassica napus]
MTYGVSLSQVAELSYNLQSLHLIVLVALKLRMPPKGTIALSASSMSTRNAPPSDNPPFSSPTSSQAP